MNEERPVTLRFFDTSMTAKLAKLCTKLGVNLTVTKDGDKDKCVTSPMKAGERSKFMSAWANISMERITE